MESNLVPLFSHDGVIIYYLKDNFFDINFYLFDNYQFHLTSLNRFIFETKHTRFVKLIKAIRLVMIQLMLTLTFHIDFGIILF